MGSNRTRSIRRITALLAAGVVIGACAGGDDDDSAGDSVIEEPAEQSAEEPGDEPAQDGGGAGGDAADGDAGALDPIDLGQVGRDVVIEMDVTLSSDDVGRSVATLSATARRLGGGVASSEVDFAGARDDEGGFALLVLKVPPDSVDDLLAGLDAVGTVESINQRAQDVTEQLVDLDVRIDNARESVVTVRELMDRAEDLSDLVTLEGELIRRQTDLERLEAQRRNLGERVALSTITVQVVPTASVPDDDEDRTIGDAVADGWRSFVAVVAAVAFALAITLPFIVLGLAAVAAWWLLSRRRDPSRSRATPAPAAMPADPTPGRTPEEHPDREPADATASPPG